MACAKLANIIGVPPTADQFRNSVFNEGAGCILKFRESCQEHCKKTSLDPKPCYACLGNGYTCPQQGQVLTSKADAGCCPNVALAEQCATCLARTQGDFDLKHLPTCDGNSLSELDKIIISVSVVVVALIIGLVLYIYLRGKKALSSAQALAQYAHIGQNSRLITSLSNLGDNSALSQAVELQERQRLAREKAPTAEVAPVETGGNILL